MSPAARAAGRNHPWEADPVVIGPSLFCLTSFRGCDPCAEGDGGQGLGLFS